MRTGVEICLSPEERKRLEAIVASGSSPQKHVWRARIVLLSADGVGTMEIQRRTGKAKPTIWRWQQRFMEAGVDGLLRDATRPGRKPPLNHGRGASWRCLASGVKGERRQALGAGRTGSHRSPLTIRVGGH